MYGYCYSAYNRLAFLGGIDSNASAFFAATGITDPTIQGAINTLCVDLKKYGVFDKMKAIYPFVGGTATTHKFNLVNPADTDGAFRLSFNGGWTHSSNGATPNGTNGYADTFLTPSTTLSLNSSSLGYYGGNDIGTALNKAAMGSQEGPPYKVFAIIPTYTGLGLFGDINDGSNTYTANTNTSGFILASRTSSTQKTHFIRGTQTIKTEASTGLTSRAVVIGARRFNAIDFYSAIQHRFTFIGDGLTNEDILNLYYSVQKFQTTLGRQVGTPIYSSNATDVNARLFLGATNIQDATITSAVDTLVQGLKTDGVWTKLKAVYPFVGGTATTHKFNLANALDEDTAFRLSFSGGITHSSNGIQGNGVNGFANTFVSPLTNLSQNSVSVNLYSRTNVIGGADFGSLNLLGYLNFSNRVYTKINQTTSFSISTNTTASTGLFSFIRNSGTEESIYKNGSLLDTFTKISIVPTSSSMYLLAYNPGEFSNKQFSFASIGNGLTPTETSNLYARVQAFQTTLNRQV